MNYKINDNGVIREMTPEEIKEMEQLQSEFPAPAPSPFETRLANLEKTVSGEIRAIPAVFTPQLAFSKGERGYWKGKVYESIVDGNVWKPDEGSRTWKEC